MPPTERPAAKNLDWMDDEYFNFGVLSTARSLAN
jgi:hypothetical protein